MTSYLLYDDLLDRGKVCKSREEFRKAMIKKMPPNNNRHSIRITDLWYDLGRDQYVVAIL